MRKLLLLLFVHILSLAVQGQSAPGILVKVLDQEGRPLSGEPLSIQGGPYFQADASGEFVLSEKSLRLPVRAEFRSELLSVLEIAYFEEEARLEIKAKRSYHPDDVLKIRFRLPDTVFTKEFDVLIKGEQHRVNTNGLLVFQNPVRLEPGELELEEFEIQDQQMDSEAHELLVLLQAKEQVQEPQDTLVLSYEADFERLTKELEKERHLYGVRNQEIQQEILKIRDKLLQETFISPEQRQELKLYLMNMEKVLQENSEVIRRSEERTKEAMAKLRAIIVEKDSMNMVAREKIVQLEQRQAAVEEDYRQTIAVYVSVIVLLIIIALIIYFFAVKLRKQKTWLKEVNKRLKNMQQELTKSLHELNFRKAQIEDHNNQLELFVYKASHDIKGPLRSIIGLTQIGLHEVKEVAAREYFQHIQKSTQRLDNLLADLLQLTKVKQAEIEKTELDLPGMVRDIVQSLRNIKNADQVDIQLDIPEDISFRSDEKMLYSVMQNFIENGIKYFDPRKENPFLKIIIRQEKEKTSFLFEDNGLGIGKEHLPKIFDMFFKTDANSDGSGLGLHIVKVTVEKLGGTIKVKSQAGEGSLFTLTFYE